MSKKQATATKVTAELNPNLESPVSMIPVRKLLHEQNICGRAVIPKSLVTGFNFQKSFRVTLHSQNLVDG
ncbi:hypothetical protein TNCV_4211581 [Trichonephila clavipes]|nr:hypothetical protein TNCV_4211581 [Trichonephila clavipes]